ncbi:Alginate biosynthesis sensor protein KinB [Marinomonas spartinae]|uniref:sensor histidine kinase n=1 Tax=Marinomonas spartinae TaxID=1792290 RepID=UPI000808D774|nr:HAMP domain-containing sensor histidine kinase [Marinomonas spartinae]SBS25367.1 Alginate biosynthesis sensor protein KinB [Marinomonas spartinae]
MRWQTKKKHYLLSSWAFILFIIIVIAWRNYELLKAQYISQIRLDETEILSRGSSLFHRELGYIKNVTLFLRSNIEGNLSSIDPSNTPLWRQSVIDTFSQFASISPLVSQVRWLSLDGQERIRVNRLNETLSVIKEEHLQSKANRYYFRQAKRATGNQVYISPIDLNMENGQIVTPIEPTVRAVIMLQPQYNGMLVVNYHLRSLFESLRALANDSVFLDVVSPTGEWLISQDKELEWAQTLSSLSSEKSLSSRYPEAWKTLLMDDFFASFIYAEQVWSGMKVLIDGGTLSQSQESSYLYFIARSWPQNLLATRYSLLAYTVVISLLFFVLFSGLAWWQIEAYYKRQALLLALESEKVHLKNTNKELNTANQRLVLLQDELVENSRLASLGMMVAGLAHEMNTPLGGTKMALSSLQALLMRDEADFDKSNYRSMIHSLHLAEKNLIRAIELVSSFKRLTSNQAAQDSVSFQLYQVLNDFMSTCRPRLKQYPNIKVEVDCPQDIRLQSHPGIVTQVIQNLIDNALSHGFDEGMTGMILIKARCHSEHLTLIVQDDGKGIAPEMKDTLFNPFATTGRSRMHTGLGLYLVHQWVYSLLKGRIEVSSEQGQGTCFTLTFALNGDEA